MSIMCPDRSAKYFLYRQAAAVQRGASIIAAIFLLLLMVILAALMANFSTVQQASSTQDFLGNRAYQAARAGLEWGVYQAIIKSSCATGTSTVALEDDLAPFTVLVQCTVTSTTEGGVGVSVYEIVSIATSGSLGTPYYVERRLEAIVS